MKVLYREDDELILKEVLAMSVKGEYVVLESETVDKRTLIKAHDSWSNEDLELLLRANAAGSFIDIEPISRAKT
jgi:hypothetical protein